jgi:hypothetical protein
MGKINIGRVLLGGVAAGVVVNLGELLRRSGAIGHRMELALVELGLPKPGTGTLVSHIVLGFLLGVLLVWLYAAVRTRFGPGPKTAVLAGLFVWLFAVLWPGLDAGLMGVYDPDLLVFISVWGLFQLLIAALVGAWLYREAETG